MTVEINESIELYEFTGAELETGRFPWMDTVLQRWAHLLESTLFEQLGVALEIETPPVEWMRFEQFYTGITQRQPLYIFDSQTRGQGIVAIGNKFAHACLHQNDENRLGNLPDSFPNLHSGNHKKLHHILQCALQDFEKSWTGIAQFELTLIRMTSHRFRARIMMSLEKCVIAKLLFHGHGFSTDLTLCFPYSSLDTIFQKLARKKVLPPQSMNCYYSELQEHFYQKLKEKKYEMVAEFGTVEATARKTIQPGKVLPLNSRVDNKLVLKINGKPILIGDVGQAEDNYAVRIVGKYESKEETNIPARKFTTIQWPEA